MPVKSDALLRLLIADLVGERVTRESMTTLREDIADLKQRLHAADDYESLPHRQKYLRVVNGFLDELLDLHLRLVDDVERELAD
jgi:hypothetical protein